LEEELAELQNRYAKLQENYLQLKDDAQELHRELQTARDTLDHAVKQEPRAKPQESTHTKRMLREELAHKDLVVRTLNRRLQNAEFQTRDKLAAAENQLCDLRLQYAEIERENQELNALYAGAKTEVENLQRTIANNRQELANAHTAGRFQSPDQAKMEPQTPRAPARLTAQPPAANRAPERAEPTPAVKPENNKIPTPEIVPETPPRKQTRESTADLLLAVYNEPQPIVITTANMPVDYYGPDLHVGSLYVPIIETPLKIKRGQIDSIAKFTGSRNFKQTPIDRWIEKYELFCRKYALPPHEAVAHLDEVLTGEAHKWYFEQSAILAHAPDGRRWRTWRTKLLQEYTNRDLQDQRIKEFDTLNYRDFDNLINYATRKWQLRQDVFGVDAHHRYPETWMIDHLYQLMGVIMRNQLKMTHFGGQPHSWSQLIAALRIFFTNKAYREANDPCITDRKQAPKSMRPPKPQRDQPNMPLVTTANASPTTPAGTQPPGSNAVSRWSRCGSTDHPDTDCPEFKARKLRCDYHTPPSTTHNPNMCRNKPTEGAPTQPPNPRPRRQFTARVNFAASEQEEEEAEPPAQEDSTDSDSDEEDF
jgi:hypothetical protein